MRDSFTFGGISETPERRATSLERRRAVGRIARILDIESGYFNESKTGGINHGWVQTIPKNKPQRIWQSFTAKPATGRLLA
jgi:hypothetical protein